MESIALGTPVLGTNIGGIPELIEDGKTGVLLPPGDTKSLGAALCRLDLEPERLAAMSTHILELTQYENTEIVSGKTLYSLDEQLRRCIHQQERSWLQKGLTVEGDLDRADYYGNEELVEHIWSNLIANAIRFTPAGGQITVVLRKEPGAVSVAVSDTGIGMDAETQRHIFDKFYRGEQGSDSRGNGLGLSIVRRAVELCGGTVEVFSRPGEGATFTVTLGMEDRGGGKERGFQGAK